MLWQNMCLSVSQAAVTNHQKLKGLRQHTLIPFSDGGQSSGLKWHIILLEVQGNDFLERSPFRLFPALLVSWPLPHIIPGFCFCLHRPVFLL